MKAIILAGGYATRLRPLTLTKPKAMLPILGKPLLDWIIESLARAGIRQIVLSVRYLSDVIKYRYRNLENNNIELVFVEETKPLGDAGPLRLIHERVGLDETFVVIYGDVFSDVDIAKLVEFHHRKNGIATLTLVEVDDPSRYGVAVLDSEGRIVDFVEKPQRSEAPSNLANAGIYVFEPDVIKYVPTDRASKLAKDVIPKLVRNRVAYGYVHRGLWNDIGVPSDYLKANMEALAKFYPRSYIDPTASIDSSVEIIHPIYVGRNARIGEGCRIGPFTVVGHDVVIERGSWISRSIVFDGTYVGSYAYIEGAIIGERSYLGRWVRIEQGCVLGDQVALSDGVLLARNIVVLPFKELEHSIHEEGKVVL